MGPNIPSAVEGRAWAMALLLGVTAFAPRARAVQKLLAVLPLDVKYAGKHMKDADRVSLEEMLRDVASNSLPGWTVMTGATTVQLLVDNGIDPTKCSDSSCQLQTARQIEADKFFTGAVQYVDDEYTVSIRLIDTKTGRILAATRVLGKNTLALEAAFQKQAPEFFARAGLGGMSPAMATGTGTAPVDEAIGGSSDNIDLGAMNQVVVKFASRPDGAVVLVDGTLLCQATPCSKMVAKGEHQVSMQREGYEPGTKNLDAKDGARLKLKLQRISARLTVETDPSGLALTIDGKSVGKSPLSPTDLAPGTTHTVLIDDPCWQKTGERLTLKKGEDRDLNLTAKARMAGLRLTAQDTDGNALEGRALVDGNELGKVPGAYKLSICTSKVDVEAGGQTQSVELSLREGKVSRKKVVFQAQAATNVSAASAEASSNGETFRAAGLEWQMQPAPRGMNWDDAKSYCANLALAGGRWRLPTKHELLALFNAKTASAEIAAYPHMNEWWYWSSTPRAWYLAGAWYIDFSNGYARTTTTWAPPCSVRCVREPSNALSKEPGRSPLRVGALLLRAMPEMPTWLDGKNLGAAPQRIVLKNAAGTFRIGDASSPMRITIRYKVSGKRMTAVVSTDPWSIIAVDDGTVGMTPQAMDLSKGLIKIEFKRPQQAFPPRLMVKFLPPQ